MSSSHRQKYKTGIPVFKITPRNGCGDGDVPSARSQQTVVVPLELQQSRSLSRNQTSSQNQKRDDAVTVNSSYPKLKTTKKNQCPETWADEVIQSQSQKLRNTSLSDSRKRRDDMEKHLHEAEVQLVTMGKLLEQREKLMNEAAEEAAKKTEELEQKIINQDGLLVKNGIDPVTGMQITLNDEGEKKVEATKKITKKRVQEMRAKLQQMNNQAESYLSDIENTLQFLNGLEGAVDRAGQPPGNILQRFDYSDYEEDEKQAYHLHQIDSGVNIAIRSVLSEKMMQFGNYSVNVSVHDDDDDNAKHLYLEDQCEKLGNVGTAEAERAVQETVP